MYAVSGSAQTILKRYVKNILRVVFMESKIGFKKKVSLGDIASNLVSCRESHLIVPPT